MWKAITEPDWRVFRQVHEAALGRFFEDAVSRICSLASDSSRPAVDRYARVEDFIQRQNGVVSQEFGNPKRATALHQLALMYAHGLITEDELSRFSGETREAIAVISSLAGG